MNILGISDEVTTCECCGKSGLKRTVVISCGDGMKFYGTSCASKAFKTPQDTIKKSATMFETAVKITKSYGLTAAKIGMTIAVSKAREAIETALRNAGYKTTTTEQIDAVLARI